MAKAGNINATATLDESEFVSSINKLIKSIDKLTNAQRKSSKKMDAGITANINNVKKLRTELGAFGRIARKVFIIGSIAAAAKQVADFTLAISRASDATRLMKLKLDAFLGDVNAFDKISASAKRLGTDLQATVDIVTRFSIATDGAFNTDKVIKWAESLQASALVIGKSTQEITSGLLQVSQAMLKGKLDGDEFRTVMETFPILSKKLAIVMAEEMKKSGKSILDMGADGKIGVSKLIEAIELAGSSSIKLAENLNTVDQSIERLNVAWLDFAAASGPVVKTATDWIINLATKGFENLTAKIKSATRAYEQFTGATSTATRSDIYDEYEKATERLINSQKELDDIRAKKDKNGLTGLSPAEIGDLLMLPGSIDRITATIRDLKAEYESTSSNNIITQLDNELKTFAANRDYIQKLKDQKARADEAEAQAAERKAEAFRIQQERKLDAVRKFDEEARRIQAEAFGTEEEQLRLQEEIDIADKEREIERFKGSIDQKKLMIEDFEAWKLGRRELTNQQIIASNQRASEKENQARIKNQTALEKFMSKEIDMNKKMSEIAVSGFEDISAGIADMVVSGKKNWGDFFKDFMNKIAKMIIQALILKAIQSAIGMMGGGGGSIATTSGGAGLTGFGSIGGGSSVGAASSAGLFANGGAFTKFANGGDFTNSIVNKPTKFAYGGGLGLMGEAGPEAIMPLTRGSNGKLGVQASGGGGGNSSPVIVNVINNTDSKSEVNESTDANGNSVIDVIIEQVKESFSNDITTGRGEFTTSLEQTYSLNRAVGSYT